METKQQFFLRSDQIRENIIESVKKLPLPIIEKQKVKNGKSEQEIEIEKGVWTVEIRPKTRSLEQNAKLHAMLTDIANQCEFQGKKRDVETWKAIFVSAHKIATGGQAEMAIGLEGEVINLRESTAQMGVKRLASLIEYLTAWGMQNGVHFNDRYGFWGR